MKVSDETEANIIAFSSGWVMAATHHFWGYDKSILTSLVADFALFATDDAVASF